LPRIGTEKSVPGQACQSDTLLLGIDNDYTGSEVQVLSPNQPY